MSKDIGLFLEERVYSPPTARLRELEDQVEYLNHEIDELRNVLDKKLSRWDILYYMGIILVYLYIFQ